MNSEQAANEAKVHIDIVSDLVCPWCFVGKRHLDAALLQFGRPVSIRWLPFFLNPGTPPEGEPYRAFLENKFGGAAAVEEMWANVSKAGNKTGISFAFEKIGLRANTLAAHRLIHYFQTHNMDATALVERIFNAGFCEGRFIGDLDVLANLAHADSEAQERNETFDWLKGNTDTQVVLALEAQIRQMGINGVPLFIFNGKNAFSGAQPPAVLLDALLNA